MLCMHPIRFRHPMPHTGVDTFPNPDGTTTSITNVGNIYIFGRASVSELFVFREVMAPPGALASDGWGKDAMVLQTESFFAVGSRYSDQSMLFGWLCDVILMHACRGQQLWTRVHGHQTILLLGYCSRKLTSLKSESNINIGSLINSPRS